MLIIKLMFYFPSPKTMWIQFIDVTLSVYSVIMSVILTKKMILIVTNIDKNILRNH